MGDVKTAYSAIRRSAKEKENLHMPFDMCMRLLANQNVPRSVVDTPRSSGYDVEWVQESQPGRSDPALLQYAVSEERVVLTFDKDFGTLAFNRGIPASCGVILVRLTPTAPGTLANRLVDILSERNDWAESFAVINDATVRMRPLPT